MVKLSVESWILFIFCTLQNVYVPWIRISYIIVSVWISSVIWNRFCLCLMINKVCCESWICLVVLNMFIMFMVTYNYDKIPHFFKPVFCYHVTVFCRMSFLNIQLLVRWSGLMQRIHFFYSIQVGAQENLRYLCAVTAVLWFMLPFSSFLYLRLLLF